MLGGGVGGDDVEADLRDADGAEAGDHFQDQGPADAVLAGIFINPDIVDEAILLDGVDGDLGIHGGNEETDNSLIQLGEEKNAARLGDLAGEPADVALFGLGAEWILRGRDALMKSAGLSDHGKDEGKIVGGGGADGEGIHEGIVTTSAAAL